MNLEVIGNKFENCGIDGANDGYLRGAVTLVEAHFNNKKTKVLIEKNEMINVDLCVRIQYNSQTADMLEANVVNNKFISWAEAHPITNNDLGADNLIKALNNTHLLSLLSPLYISPFLLQTPHHLPFLLHCFVASSRKKKKKE